LIILEINLQDKYSSEHVSNTKYRQWKIS
jgi:hypothetical protein